MLIAAGPADATAFAAMAAPLLAGRRALPRDAIVVRALADLRRRTSSKVGMLERARDLR